jgi:hypothetical protein
MPRDEQHTGRSLSPPPYDNNRALVSFTLTKLHENVSWPLRLFPPEITLDAGVETTHSYIIFIWPQHEDTDIMETLIDQVETLKVTEGGSWNPRGKILVVVADSIGVSPKELGLQIYAELWKEHFIIDNTILIATRDNYVPINGKNYTDGLRKDTLDLYTGLPYENGKCGDVTDVILLDQWRLHNGTFIHNANIFPLKITDNYHGCQIRVATFGPAPYIILKGNSTDSDGNVVYNLGGIAVENMLLAADKMKVTPVFLKPSLRLAIEEGALELGNLLERKSDIVIGVLPLLALFVTTWFQPTIPYEYTAGKWFVPCPQPVARMEKVIHTYTLPVWLTMATVLLLTAILWWGLANWRLSSLKDSRTFRTLSYCLYNAWAVGMGVSATNTPKIWTFRSIFLVYIWYCFAMSTVFQAFFTSYLVEPGYGKKFETFDDLLHSHLAYGYNGGLEFGMATTSFDEYLRFPSSRREDCNDLVECTRRIANNDQLCIISAPKLSQYTASEMGIRDASKYICSFEDNVFTTGFISLLNNGSPILNRLNVLTRRSLEGGLLDQYWAQLSWITSLRSKLRFGDGEEHMYFVFSISHMRPAFFVLGFGYLLSSVVFLAEIIVKWIAKGRTVKWSKVRMGRHCELITAPLHTRLNIQNRIYATTKNGEFPRKKYFDFKRKK